MGKYFGTDGIRGVYGRTLDEGLTYRAGVALANYYGKGKYIIVRDTRVSGQSLENALIEGIIAAGGEPVVCGVLPTPAAAFLTKSLGGCAGVVISASHNPPEFNGIKIFDGKGLKLDAETELEIEDRIDEVAEPYYEKCISQRGDPLLTAGQQYKDYLTSFVPIDLKGLSIHIDCAFGATAGGTAKDVFSRLGASVTAFNDTFEGRLINHNCGAVHPEFLQRSMGNKGIGFAFDGDGDRLAVVFNGEVIDGDTLLYNLAEAVELRENVVVGTVMSNLAVEERFRQRGIEFVRTAVGDKNIARLMYSQNYSLGGEQSGHFIINSDCLTGDAILAALYLLKALYKDGELKPPTRLALYPQRHYSHRAEASILEDKDFQKIIADNEDKMGNDWRIVVRMSGTEPIVRIMAEGKNAEQVDEIIGKFRQFFTLRNKTI